MKMIRRGTLLAFVALVLAAPAADAHERGGFSIGIGLGVPAYRPWYHHHHYHGPYYRPYPVYVAPAPIYVPRPVVVQPVPVIAQPATIVVPPAQVSASPAPSVQPAPAPIPALSPIATTSPSADNPAVGHQLQLLIHPDERVRSDAVMQLGRMRVDRAVDQLTATLAGDRSPLVREAAARALGLIGARRAMTALQYAAQADADRDVRRSAQFSVEVIATNLQRP